MQYPKLYATTNQDPNASWWNCDAIVLYVDRTRDSSTLAMKTPE